MVPLEWKVFDIVSVMLHCHMMPAIALFGQQAFYRYILIEYFGSIKLKDIRTCTALERKGLDCGIYKNIIWKLSESYFIVALPIWIGSSVTDRWRNQQHC